MPTHSLYYSIATVSVPAAKMGNVASSIWMESSVCNPASPEVAICGSLLDNRVCYAKFCLCHNYRFLFDLPCETCPSKFQEKQAGMTWPRCFDAAGKSMPNPRQTSVRNVRQDPASRRKNQSVQAMPLHLLLLTRMPEEGLEGASFNKVRGHERDYGFFCSTQGQVYF